MQSILITKTLDWAKGQDGFPSLSNTIKYDDAYCLRELLSKAAMLEYATLSHLTRHGYSKGVYYESTVSFLTELRKNLQAEANVVRNRSAKDKQDFEELFNVPSGDIVASKARILDVIDFLLWDSQSERFSGIINHNEFEVFDMFRFGGHGLVSNFYKAMAVWKHHSLLRANDINAQIPGEVLAMPIALPTMSRRGYSIDFSFVASVENPPLLTTNGGTRYFRSISTFLSAVQLPARNSDQYLAYIANCSLSNAPAISPQYQMIVALKSYFSNKNMFSKYTDYLACDPLTVGRTFVENADTRANLVSVLSQIHSSANLIIGPKTSMLLQLIARCPNYPHVKGSLAKLLANGPAPVDSGETLETKDSGIECVELLVEPDHLDFSLEAAGKEVPNDAEIDTPPPEDPPKDGSSDPNDGEDTPKDGSSDPNDGGDTPADGTDPTNGDTPAPEDAPDNTPSVRVKVPKGSYLLKIREAKMTTMDEWMYIVEVVNIINRILDDPPDTLKDTHKTILQKISQELIYCLDVESIESLLKSVLNTVPKATT